MGTDCKQLTPNAQKIFDKLKPFYPRDSWQNPQWAEEGKVFDNGWHDLRKSADRQKLMDWKRSLLGSWVETQADILRKKTKSLHRLTMEHFTPAMQRTAEQLLILKDLDFQIETMDLVES